MLCSNQKEITSASGFWDFLWWFWVLTQGLVLVKQILYHLSHALMPSFASVIFWVESYVNAWPASDIVLPTYSLLHSWDFVGHEVPHLTYL
jgi:hypothetical protein